jgi:hypothetical protein
VSAQGGDVGRLSEAEYERMCREVAAGHAPHVSAESLLFALCKQVYHHLHGYRRDMTLPYSEAPRTEVYKSALRRMVEAAQSEPFDALEIAGRYIKGV